jgi:tripartite-type tricarboxylate transporter receptor subunit TctC
MKWRLAAFLAVFGCSPAAAFNEYPSKYVKVVVGSPPGDPTDLLARITAPALQRYFKKPFIIDNHPGANGNVATAIVAKAPHDGHTLLIVSATFATSVSLYPRLAFDPQRDFLPIGRIAQFNNVLVVNSTSRLGTLGELLSAIRATPGRITIASSGTGTTSHLAAELMKVRAGWLNALHVPYRGNPAALADLMGAHVDAHVATVASAQPHIRTGRLKGLAVTSLKRSRALPQVPTLDETGFPGFEAIAWNALVAPAGTPYDTVVRVNVAISEILGSQRVRQLLAVQGAEPIADTPERFAEFLRTEVEKWGKVVKDAGIGTEQ